MSEIGMCIELLTRLLSGSFKWRGPPAPVEGCPRPGGGGGGEGGRGT